MLCGWLVYLDGLIIDCYIIQIGIELYTCRAVLSVVFLNVICDEVGMVAAAI